jgi:2-methylcitrate dehydratase PrpD
MMTTTIASDRPTAPDGVTGRLASWLAATTLDDIPADVRRRAAHLLLDGIGCALIGAQLPWSRTATRGVLELEGEGASAIMGWGRTTSAPAAVLLNGTFIQGFELDDFHPRAPLHTASLVLPPLLATAEQLGRVPGERFLLGAVLGCEVGPRVGLALHGAQMLTRGWHSGSVFGTHAAATASGVLRGLSAARFEDALGLAATQSAGLMAAQYEADSKRMHHGFAARNGFYAAGLAAAGYTGIKQVFERPYGGFLSVFGEGHDPEPDQIARKLGERWETTQILIKSYAAMGGLHGAIDAVLALQATDPVAADAIARIDVEVSEAVYHHGWWQPERPLTTIGAQMNIGYAVAAALLDGQVLPEQFTPARIDSDDIWQLIGRTRVHLAEEFAKLPPEERFSTRLTLTLTDGTSRSTLVPQPKGGPANPLSNADVVAKYRNLTGRVMGPARLEAIERIVLGMEDVADVADLIELLADPVAGALD